MIRLDHTWCTGLTSVGSRDLERLEKWEYNLKSGNTTWKVGNQLEKWEINLKMGIQLENGNTNWKWEYILTLYTPWQDEFFLYFQNFNFKIRKDHQKNFLWESRLWVGRRKEPILGYVPKNDKKKNFVHKGLKIIKKGMDGVGKNLYRCWKTKLRVTRNIDVCGEN